MKQLPSEFQCPICKTHIKIKESETCKRIYRCKSCEKVVDLTSTRLVEEKPFLYKPAIKNLILLVIPLLLCFFGYKSLHNNLKVSLERYIYSSKEFKGLLDNLESVNSWDIKKETEKVMFSLKKKWEKNNTILIFLDRYFIIPIAIFIIIFSVISFGYKKFDKQVI